jgi:hydroxyacylglutathione hydrolase
LLLKRLVVGPLQTNCYLVGCPETREGMVIDPGAEGEKILAAATELKLQVKYIINTHGHADHVGANLELKNSTGALLLLGKADLSLYTDSETNLSAFMGTGPLPAPDRLLEEGECLRVGALTVEVITTPGHTPGGICLLINEGVLFSGDTLFSGSIGRTDFPGGSHRKLIESIKNKLLLLGEDVRVYPGHMEETTIGCEKKFNPFIR